MKEYLDVQLPQDEDGPVFNKPWQAQAFALIMHLYGKRLFEWKEWVSIFSKKIKSAPALPTETANDAYYRQWCSAMEELVISLGLSAQEVLADRAKEWRQAYLNTPHGLPIELQNAACPPSSHVHHHVSGPVAVSPGTR